MTVYKLPWRPLAGVGLLSGLVQVVAGVVMYVSGVYFAPWSGLVSLLLLGICIALGIRWYVRQVLDGRRSYVTALLVGIVIAVSSGLVYVTYNVISISFVYPHFLEDMAQARFLQRPPQPLEGIQAAQVLESLRAQTTLPLVVGSNLRGFCLFGTILSAVMAVAFREKAARG